jgi:predicted ATPase
MGKLTLLSGLNGTGKSSVLQSLLLLRQSRQQRILPGPGLAPSDYGLALNGDLVRLGTKRDALYESAADDSISFDITADIMAADAFLQLVFSGNTETDVLTATFALHNGVVFEASLFTDDFHYLQAERMGPRTSFPISAYAVDSHRQLGIQGEYTAHYLSIYGDSDISCKMLIHPEARSQNLIHQVEAWMSVISPGLRIELQDYKDMDVVNIRFSFEQGKQVTNQYRATNVGFGITFSLPILVALLASRPGSLLLLENPEAHLHPRGQVRIGELMALAANCGIQVIVETHSDHILNGIRLAVHGGIIPPADVRLYYFDRPKEQMGNSVVSPQIDRNGRINDWPDGFFDEMDRSLGILLAPARE